MSLSDALLLFVMSIVPITGGLGGGGIGEGLGGVGVGVGGGGGIGIGAGGGDCAGVTITPIVPTLLDSCCIGSNAL